jgi:2-amino-4-hydroxy-6-hydroxymethyldihydropteridine diphosphokinase
LDLQEVGVLLGTNMGNRYQNLTKARAFLEEEWGAPLRVSAIYETAAWGGVSVAPYLNQLLVFGSDGAAHNLLAFCLEVEARLGRSRELRWGDRVMDIDILFYGQQQVQQPELVIPHPRMAERAFVLQPLVEVAAAWQHPVLNLSAAALLAHCSDTLEVKIWEGEEAV